MSQPLVVPFAITEAEVRKRFLARMRSGVFSPSDIEAVGAFREVEALFVPVRLVTVSVVSNWTGESGSKGAGGRIFWSPLSGQHRDAYRDLPQLVARGYDGWVFRLGLRHIDRAVFPTDDVLAAGKSVAPTESESSTVALALEQAKKLEYAACTRMLPGPGRRNVRVNATIESHEVQEILLPFWRVVYSYAGTTIPGWVDGVTGSVHANPPVSTQRVVTLIGGGVAFVGAAALVAFLFTAMVSSVAASDAARAAEQRHAREVAAQEEARLAKEALVQQLNQDAPAAAEGVRGRLAAADQALAREDLDAARTAINDATAALVPYQTLDPMPEPIAPWIGQLDPRSTHLHALELEDQATAFISGGDYVGGADLLAQALAALAGLPPDYAGAGAAKKVSSRLASEQRSNQGRAKKQAKERADAEALAALCGSAPVISPWGV